MHDILLQDGEKYVECDIRGLDLTLSYSDDGDNYYIYKLRDVYAYRDLKHAVNNIYEDYADGRIGYKRACEYIQSINIFEFVVEEWRDVDGFLGYQVSNTGCVRSFWKRKHYPTGYGTYNYLSDTSRPVSTSDDGNGYLKLMIYRHDANGDVRRYCRKVHKLVADAFLPKDLIDDSLDYTVDHIRSGMEGKLDNSLGNLRWLTRADNIKKAYRDGVCNDRILRQQVPVIAIDDWTGLSRYYHSVKEASQDLRLKRDNISHALDRDSIVGGRYYFERAGREDKLLYEHYDLQLIPWV